jgi:nitrate/nitrite transporter NarK
MPGGISLMILAAPPLLQASGWRGLWIAVAVLALLGLVTLWVFGGRPHIRQTGAAALPISKNLRIGATKPGPWLIGGCFAIYGAQLFAIVTWMPTFMIEQRGAGAATASALTAIVVVANGACNVLGGWLLHRGAMPWAMMAIAGAVMAACAFATFSIWLPDAARYASSLILCGAGGIVGSATFAIAPAFAATPAQLGIVNGILVQASNLAQFVGPAALAALVAKFGRWESALWAMVGINVLLIVLALFVHRQEKVLPA